MQLHQSIGEVTKLQWTVNQSICEVTSSGELTADQLYRGYYSISLTIRRPSCATMAEFGYFFYIRYVCHFLRWSGALCEMWVFVAQIRAFIFMLSGTPGGIASNGHWHQAICHIFDRKTTHNSWVSLANLYTWQAMLLHSMGLQLAKSGAKLALPDMWLMIAWFLLTRKNVDTLELFENSIMWSLW